MLHVKLFMLAAVTLDHQPGRPHYIEGERYDVRQDMAAELVRMGAAEPLEVCEQWIGEAGVMATTEERAACLDLMKSLVPPAPPPDPAEKAME